MQYWLSSIAFPSLVLFATVYGYVTPQGVGSYQSIRPQREVLDAYPNSHNIFPRDITGFDESLIVKRSPIVLSRDSAQLGRVYSKRSTTKLNGGFGSTLQRRQPVKNKATKKEAAKLGNINTQTSKAELKSQRFERKHNLQGATATQHNLVKQQRFERKQNKKAKKVPAANRAHHAKVKQNRFSRKQNKKTERSKKTPKADRKTAHLARQRKNAERKADASEWGFIDKAKAGKSFPPKPTSSENGGYGGRNGNQKQGKVEEVTDQGKLYGKYANENPREVVRTGNGLLGTMGQTISNAGNYAGHKPTQVIGGGISFGAGVINRVLDTTDHVRKPGVSFGAWKQGEGS